MLDIVPSSPVAASLVLALNEGDLKFMDGLRPNSEVFPFIDLIQNMVGGLWAIAIYVLVGAWICTALAWVGGRFTHSSMMQQISGSAFIWCAIATMIVGSASSCVSFFATQSLF